MFNVGGEYFYVVGLCFNMTGVHDNDCGYSCVCLSASGHRTKLTGWLMRKIVFLDHWIFGTMAFKICLKVSNILQSLERGYYYTTSMVSFWVHTCRSLTAIMTRRQMPRYYSALAITVVVSQVSNSDNMFTAVANIGKLTLLINCKFIT